MKTQAKNTIIEQVAAEPKAILHEIFRTDEGKFQFQFFGEDGSPVLFSQAYRTERDAQKGLDSVLRNLPKPERFQFFVKNGQFYFLLFAGNREEIAHSCPFLNEKAAKSAAQFLQKATGKSADFQAEEGRIELEPASPVNLPEKTTNKNDKIVEKPAAPAPTPEKNRPALTARHSFRLDLYPTDNGDFHARAEHPESGDMATFKWDSKRFERFGAFIAQKMPTLAADVPAEILGYSSEPQPSVPANLTPVPEAANSMNLHELFKKSPAEFVKKIAEIDLQPPVLNATQPQTAQKLPQLVFPEKKEGNELGLLNPTNQPTDFLHKQLSHRFLLALKTPAAVDPVETAELEIRKVPEGDFFMKKTLFPAMQFGQTSFFKLPKIDLPAGVYRFDLAGLASMQLTVC